MQRTLRTRQHAPRQWFSFGPGTLIALLAALMLILSGQLTKKPPPDPNAGRIVYEADESGKLRRVEAPSGTARAFSIPWKPEASFLLEHASALKLDEGQRKQLKELQVRWFREKAALQQAIQGALSEAGARLQRAKQASHTTQGVSPTQIVSSLQDYSALSRRYDERRAHYWAQATALLTEAQRQQLEKIAAFARRRQKR